MSAPAESRVVADVGGTVVVERGPLVLLIDGGTGPPATLAFVLAVIAVVCGGFGVAVLLVPSSVTWWVALGFVAVGVVLGGLASAVVGRIRSARRRPLDERRPVAVFDRARRVYVDGDLEVPLHHVRLQTRMQLTSSSPSLVVVTPAGTRILKRGNPFNGGLGNLEAVLNGLLFGPPR